MSIDTVIALLIYMLVQAVVFGIGTVAILATPLSAHAMTLMPIVIGASLIVSIPIAWLLAPRLRARFEPHSRAPGK